MTASSVGLFPCRVQPIGLPPTAASNAPFNNSGNVSRSSSSSSITTNNNNNNNNQISRHPPMRHIRTPPSSTEVRRVSRNLFGKAERSEIDQVMRAEYERNCTYMRERYCFDIRNPPASENESNSSKARDGPLPTLIAKEVELQACKRQRKCYSEEQESSDELKDTEKTTTPTITTQEQNYASLKTPTSGVSKKTQISPAALENDRNSENFAAAIETTSTTTTTIKTTSSETENLPQNLSITTTATVANSQQQTNPQQKQQLILCNAATNNERHKINAKQTLITDCFNVRKSATASTLQQHNTKGGNLDEVLAQQRTNANVLLKVQIFKTSTPAQT